MPPTSPHPSPHALYDQIRVSRLSSTSCAGTPFLQASFEQSLSRILNEQRIVYSDCPHCTPTIMKFNYKLFTFSFLNAIRVISIVSLILVFSSSIFVITTDVRAVNAFLAGKSDQDMLDCDYIECVLSLLRSASPGTDRFTEAAMYPTRPPVFSGRLSTTCSSS